MSEPKEKCVEMKMVYEQHSTLSFPKVTPTETISMQHQNFTFIQRIAVSVCFVYILTRLTIVGGLTPTISLRL